MEQLRIHVERIVRPIRAAAGRKNTMRNELLAHLVQKAEALIAGGADESTACAEAIEQLGDPAALRADLQATVPALERIAYARLPDFGFFDAYFEKHTGESALHFAFVRTAFIASAIGIVLLVMLAARGLGLLPFSRQRTGFAGYCAMMLSFFYLWTVVSNFAAYWLVDVTGFRGFMSKMTPGPAWIKAGALCLFMCVDIALLIAPMFLFLWIVNPDDAAILIGIFGGELGRQLAIGIVSVLLVLFPILIVAMKYEHEQWLKWGNLHIDD
jgi:hypothetical protein